jgi:hypothetical protein
VRHPATLLGTAVLVLSAAACSDDAARKSAEPRRTSTTPTAATPAQPRAQQSPTPRATTTPGSDGNDEEPTAEEAPFPADRRPDTADAQGGRLSPTELRFGRHQGYDRVVLELAGSGQPGWRAGYEDDPRNQGRGDRADIDGEATVELMVSGVRYPAERGAEPYDGPDSMRPSSAGVIEQVQRGPLYEGHQQLFVGVRSREPFRVFRLSDPPRVVIDVQHPR